MEELLVIVVICAAFFGESIFGFGGGLVAIPILSLFLGVQQAVTLVLIFQFCMGLLIFKTYQNIDWGIAKLMIAGLVVGTFVGTFLLSIVSDRFLLLFLAASISVFLIKSIFFQRFTIGKGRSVAGASSAGVLGGLFQGLIGTGGPILTMYLTIATAEKMRMRATLIILFFLTSIIRIGLSLWQGLFDPTLLILALFTFPFFIAAIILGHLVHAKVSQRQYQIAIYVILFFAAISMLLKAL